MPQPEVYGKVFCSTCHDPWMNQAFEEYLLNGVQKNEVILYLWQNQRTVVIGRHQNAWKEADWQSLERDGGYLARRISGGGAVYHDLGNLNFTFLASPALYDLERQVSVILEAVRSLGVDAQFSGRNDLEAAGKKFSGNAFCHKHWASMHHGTILIDSDSAQLNAYLHPSPEKIAAKGVSSVAARVVNLVELQPSLTVTQCRNALTDAFLRQYDKIFVKTEHFAVDTSSNKIDNGGLKEKFASWQWRFGASPDFEISLQTRFDWGEIELCCNTHQGRIVDCRLYSDALAVELIERLQNSLLGQAFQLDAIIEAWEGLTVSAEEQDLILDLTAWLKKRKM